MLWGPPPTGKLAHATAPPLVASMQPPISSSAVAAVEEIFTDDHLDGNDTGNRDRNAIDGQCEAGTLTDLHNTSNIPEVELFSLLEEKIPMYKLRADTTSNYSYEHSDWLWSTDDRARRQEEQPCELLSPVMMEETLKYFTLCGDRVVQMTKTYNDIDAVTRLLEEKEKDLELAAKIGQSLLEQNKQLEKRIDGIEEQLTLATDQNTQLKHDMKLKEQLLRIYTNEVSYSDSDEDASVCYDRSIPIQSKFINVEALQRKVRILEEDNLQLRMETAEMKTKTVSIEEKEAQLVQDAFKQLGEAQGREGVMTEELSRRLEETYQQKEEITFLLAQIVELQQKVKKLSIENVELQHQHQASRDAQHSLTKELQESKDKADEYFNMLAEARGEAKEIHRRSLPQGNVHVPGYNVLNPLPVFPADSLAAELVNSVEQELVGGDPTVNRRGNKREQNKNIMKTVKNVNRVANSQAPSEYSIDMYDNSQGTSPGGSTMSMAGSNRSGTPMSEQYEGDNESNNSPSGSTHQLGRGGIPGSNDLETALRRLNLRRQNLQAEEKYAEEEKLHMHDPDVDTEGSRTPTCPTPGSIWSTESFPGLPSMTGHGFRSFMPEKLQIVKPMEGSLTLYHWQRLAQPHMASMLDVRPGVMVKGFRELERDPAVYSMDDVEDDGLERTCVPSKCFVNTCSTYTYTTSTIGLLDNTLLTSSNRGPKMSDTYQMSSKPIAAKTFSTNLGLAQVLKERDVDGSVEPKVLTKVEAAAINPAGVNAGLNMFGASSSNIPLKSASEAKREAQVKKEEVEPKGMHRISSRIFSRFAIPVRSKNITDALDPETKARLMEKVKKIRAEKETSERRARTLQRQPSIPSIRTRDIVMSPVRTPKISSSGSVPIGLAPASAGSCMGIEGAVGGYSPPGKYGSQGGTIHKASATVSDEPKAHRKLFVSDDSGVELGFGGVTPGPTSTVSNTPLLTFMGTVSSNPNIACADVLGLGLRSSSSTSNVYSASKPPGEYSFGKTPYPSKYSNPQDSPGVGLGALIATETVSKSPKQVTRSETVSVNPYVTSYNPGLSSFSSTTNVYSSAKLYGSHGSASYPQQYSQSQSSHGVGLGALTMPGTVSSNPKPPSGSYRSSQSTMSYSSLSSGQQGLAMLSSSSQTSGSRPRSSVTPLTSLKPSTTSTSTYPHVPDIGLGSLLGTSRPTALPLGEHKAGEETPKEGVGVPQGSTLGPTSPMSVFVGNLSSLKDFRKTGPML